MRIIHLLPHGAGLYFPLSVFHGFTVEARPKFDRREGRLLSLLVEDHLFHSKIVPGEWTTDEFQRAATPEGESPDNSHILAGKARAAHWHGDFTGGG